MRTKEHKLNKLKELHDLEDDLNRQLNKEYGKMTKVIKEFNALKKKITKRISHNMKLRNKIINELHLP